MPDSMGESAQSQPVKSFVDKDGWSIPRIGSMPEQRQPPLEAANQRRLVDKLDRHGWRTNEQVTCYDRDGRVFIPDVLVWHPDMPKVGAIEVKSKIETPREFFDTLKQCADYTACKVLATGHKISWGAIYPTDAAFSDETDEKSRLTIGGALHFSAIHLKVFAIADSVGWESYLHPQWGEKFRKVGGHLRMSYGIGERLWSTDQGFVTGARTKMTGKRQVGGTRRNG